MPLNQTCGVCTKKTVDMLMLACAHNPCLSCAAQAYSKILLNQQANRYIYVCDICQQETVLDLSAVNELYNLSKSIKKSKTKQNILITSPTQRPKSPKTPKYKTFMSPKNMNILKNQAFYYCKSHSEEELTYYCLSCFENICSQCAIHGSHKEHQVKLAKKAVNQIKYEYMDTLGEIELYKQRISKDIQTYFGIIKQVNEKSKRDKQIISQQFQVMRNLLTNQQKDIAKSIDYHIKQNIKTLNNVINEMERRCKQIDKIKMQIQMILSKGEIATLDEFKKSFPKIQDKFQDCTVQHQQVWTQISYLNVQQLQGQLNYLKQLSKNVKTDIRKERIENASIKKGNKKEKDRSQISKI